MRKCDSCLYGEKLYDGTLICQHIVSMQGREATQDEEEMKKYDPNYELKEPMYEVKLEYDCYGHIGECTEWWKKSYYIEVLEKGYFLA